MLMHMYAWISRSYLVSEIRICDWICEKGLINAIINI